MTLARAGPLQVVPRGAFASAEHLGQVRRGASAEAHRLGDTRAEAHQTHQTRVLHRLGELLAHEAAREPGGDPGSTPLASRGPLPAAPPSAVEAPTGAPSPGSEGPAASRSAGGTDAAPSPRLQATLALIEKLEVFVKAQRPALALHLGGGFDATVEVERTGPREVALRIQGRHRPLAPADLARLREALGARGLSLSALSST
ncbi:hypothetical protein [Melittangium boletus]|uniref:hypothetical protein n=1 Tax=Melittangium boletus TaxID=83453 RepID=UPI003DA46C72